MRIGKYANRLLKAGYLKTYCGSGIYNAVADFSSRYPDVKLELTAGNHEELYDGLKNGVLDVILNDQRRAFSNEYINFELAADTLSLIHICTANRYRRSSGSSASAAGPFWQLLKTPCLQLQ